jgi:hypothetical protein
VDNIAASQRLMSRDAFVRLRQLRMSEERHVALGCENDKKKINTQNSDL